MTLFEVWQSQLGGGEDLRAILDHIPTPVVCSALGDAVRTLYINREFERTFGYQLADIPSAGDWARRAYPDEAYRYSLICPGRPLCSVPSPTAARSRRWRPGRAARTARCATS